MSTERTLTAGEAARALGISLDTLRRWDRQGRIAVSRDAANRRVVAAGEVARLRGERETGLSTRNRLPGIVRAVTTDGLMTQVEIDVTEPTRVVAIITTAAADDLGLRVGSPATALVKSTSVMVSTRPRE